MQASYDFLRAARALLDITPAQLAEKAKVSKRSIVRIEAREPVGLEISLRVQKALGCSDNLTAWDSACGANQIQG